MAAERASTIAQNPSVVNDIAELVPNICWLASLTAAHARANSQERAGPQERAAGTKERANGPRAALKLAKTRHAFQVVRNSVESK